MGVTTTRKTRLCPHREPPRSVSWRVERWARVFADVERFFSVSSMPRLPDVMPETRRVSRTLATRRYAQGIVAWRDIHDTAAREEGPRLARAKRAQQREGVTRMAVTHNARQVRWRAGMRWPGLWAAMASSTASTQAHTQGQGCPRTRGVPMGWHALRCQRASRSHGDLTPKEGHRTMRSRELAGRSTKEGGCIGAIWSWVGRHSDPLPARNVKNKKLEDRVSVFL